MEVLCLRERKKTRVYSLRLRPVQKNVKIFFFVRLCFRFVIWHEMQPPPSIYHGTQSVLPWISAEMLTKRCTKESRENDDRKNGHGQRWVCMTEAECRKWLLLFLNYFVSVFIKFCDLKNLLSHCYPVRFRPIHSLCAFNFVFFSFVALNRSRQFSLMCVCSS